MTTANQLINYLESDEGKKYISESGNVVTVELLKSVKTKLDEFNSIKKAINKPKKVKTEKKEVEKTNDKPKKYKKKTIPKALRLKVWSNNFKESMVGTCYICVKQLNYEDYQCGHIQAEVLGGKTEESNLKPVCSTCNQSMGTTNMDEFKKKFNGAPNADNTNKMNTFVNLTGGDISIGVPLTEGDHFNKKPGHFNMQMTHFTRKKDIKPEPVKKLDSFGRTIVYPYKGAMQLDY